ncbi:MAG: tetratricopeptide repeat protein, partial [Candidatus Thorarchaeota archaeon]
MYERFEPSERIFVNREEYLEWMDEALERCKDSSVVLHLRGIGGIGKSSLLDYWTSTIESTIRLDCEQYSEFYSRLNILAKGAVLLGVNLRRFDVLWQIRQRFVEGVEPVKETGREWAKEVVMAIPFIGTLASIGSAIGAVGEKVAPKLKSKYGDLGNWLQTNLGQDYIKRLLEILWKEPRRAEFLYLSAFLEDLNNRKKIDAPILFLFDHFENVDDEKTPWRYSGRQITETELWRVFLTSLTNCVGVMASRKTSPEEAETQVEAFELTELERESCVELLQLRGIADAELQDRIVSVSGGNPFVIGALCDMHETSPLSLSEVEDMRADTLDAVRLKTWRRLFSRSHDLLGLVEHAGLVPFFDKRIMEIISPALRSDHWDRLVALSFVRRREDGTWVLHELARDLIVAELGHRLSDLTSEVAERLERASSYESDYVLLGLAYSARGLASPNSTVDDVVAFSSNLSWGGEPTNALTFLNSVEIDTEDAKLAIQAQKGWFLSFLNRIAEAEQILKESIEVIRESDSMDSFVSQLRLAHLLSNYGVLMHRIDRPTEADASFTESLEICRKYLPASGRFYWGVIFWYGAFLAMTQRLTESEELYQEGLAFVESQIKLGNKDFRARDASSIRMRLSSVLQRRGKTLEAETALREAIEFWDNEWFIKGSSMQSLSRLLSRTNRPDEGGALIGETIEFLEGLAKTNEISLPETGNAKRIGAILQIRIGNYIKAEEMCREALDTVKEVDSKLQTDIWEPFIAYLLAILAVISMANRRFSEAEDSNQQAIEILRKFSDRSPDEYQSKLAVLLNNHGVILRHSKQEEGAFEAYREALTIGRNVADKFQETVFHHDVVSMILNNQSVLFMHDSRHAEAEKGFLESLEIRTRLAEISPELFLSRVATGMSNLAIVHAETERDEEAKKTLLEALKIRESLVELAPEIHRPSLVSNLNNLGVLLSHLGNSVEAEERFREAIEIGEELVKKSGV